MRKALIAILLIAPMLAWAGKPEPNPADYTVAVHVQSSSIEENCSAPGCGYQQRLVALVNGKSYELLSAPTPSPWLLKLGDYKARIAKNLSDQPYESYTVYEILFAGGKTQTYAIVGEHE